jgi:cytochrome c
MEGDTMAYKSIRPELQFSETEIAEGGRLYNIYCGICHGENMDGNGPMYAGGNGKFSAKPAELVGANLRMPPGQIYAAIKFGKNMMGSYASQLDIKQRWQVIAYIKKFQAGAGGDAFTMGAGTPAQPAAAAAATTQPTDTTSADAGAVPTPAH